ncbi:hypothetical protein B9Z19DRAFT_1114943 [Tuber borchii]|uniref:Uncharacterized protein n=1 Tax=Tuber borchii TaxID=42251 RepID=A0A2T6ZSK2_TUBBO|nr:hypothetical protein B9Z19DRAFT_1114943 [Tuber borchii]
MTLLTPRMFLAICVTTEPVALYAVSAVSPIAIKSAGLVFGGIFTNCQSTYSVQPKAPRTRSPFLYSGWKLSITSPIVLRSSHPPPLRNQCIVGLGSCP